MRHRVSSREVRGDCQVEEQWQKRGRCRIRSESVAVEGPVLAKGTVHNSMPDLPKPTDRPTLCKGGASLDPKRKETYGQR